MVCPYKKEITHTFKFKILGNVVSIYRSVSIASSYLFFNVRLLKSFPQNNKSHIEK